MMMPIIIAVAVVAIILFIGVRYRMMMQMIAMLVVILILGAVVGYVKYKGFQGFMAMKEGMAHMKQTISTTTAATSDWHSDLEAVGSLRAEKGVDISNELAGIVESIGFKSGDDVQEGAPLLTLRAEDSIAQLQALQAAAHIAEINYNRDKKQIAVQAIAQATLDNDLATLEGARAQVAEQKAVVDKKSIKAPFAGHIGIRNVDVGQYLQPGTAIVTLQQLAPIFLDFNLPQQSLAEIKTGQKITIKNDTYSGKVFEGEIAAINPKVDITTRNVQVRAQLSNADHALLPGMYATAEIAVGEPGNFITLPQTCITYNPYGDTVYIVRHADEIKAADTETKQDDKFAKPATPPIYKPIGDKDDDLVVEQTFVTVGRTRGDQVQILKGVKDGDTVVSAGQLKLLNGSAITVNNTVIPKDDANPKPQEQ